MWKNKTFFSKTENSCCFLLQRTKQFSNENVKRAPLEDISSGDRKVPCKARGKKCCLSMGNEKCRSHNQGNVNLLNSHLKGKKRGRYFQAEMHNPFLWWREGI